MWESTQVDLEFDLFAQAQAEDGNATLLTPMTLLERINADFVTVSLTGGGHSVKIRPEVVPGFMARRRVILRQRAPAGQDRRFDHI